MRKTHGLSGNYKTKRASIYGIWTNIKQRCFNPDCPRYKDYGGRGITMCEEWRNSFQAFYSAVGDRPKGLVLDRQDNNGNYEPGNVRWVTYEANNANSRRATQVEINGVSKPINAWCREFGLPYVTFKQRRKKGWDIVSAVSTPADKRNRPPK